MDQDHSFDGIDIDSEESQRLKREHQPVSWKARQLVNDFADLESMSPADLQRYMGGSTRNKHREAVNHAR